MIKKICNNHKNRRKNWKIQEIYKKCGKKQLAQVMRINLDYKFKKPANYLKNKKKSKKEILMLQNNYQQLKCLSKHLNHNCFKKTKIY
jgi:hypothetical protein